MKCSQLNYKLIILFLILIVFTSNVLGRLIYIDSVTGGNTTEQIINATNSTGLLINWSTHISSSVSNVSFWNRSINNLYTSNLNNNVGIGFKTPNTKLQVNGVGNFTYNIKVYPEQDLFSNDFTLVAFGSDNTGIFNSTSQLISWENCNTGFCGIKFGNDFDNLYNIKYNRGYSNILDTNTLGVAHDVNLYDHLGCNYLKTDGFGNITCGMAWGNPFNQNLNTTENVTFDNVNITDSIYFNSSRGIRTLIYMQSKKYGIPLGDGFRLQYMYDFENINFNDWLVWQKTDGNDGNPDGGFAWQMINVSGYNRTILKLDGYGIANFTDYNIHTKGNISVSNIFLPYNGSINWGSTNNPHINSSSTGDLEIYAYAGNVDFYTDLVRLHSSSIIVQNDVYANGTNVKQNLSDLNGRIHHINYTRNISLMNWNISLDRVNLSNLNGRLTSWELFNTNARDDYFNLTQNENVYGVTSFYKDVYIYNSTYITDIKGLTVNSTIKLRDVGNVTKIILNATSTLSKIWVDGNINATGQLYLHNSNDLLNNLELLRFGQDPSAGLSGYPLTMTWLGWDTGNTALNFIDTGGFAYNLLAGNIYLNNLKSCSGKLYTDSNGIITCGVDNTTEQMRKATGWNDTGTLVILNNINDNVSIGLSTNRAKLSINGTKAVLNVSYNKTLSMFFINRTNIGIHTTSPKAMLDIRNSDRAYNTIIPLKIYDGAYTFYIGGGSQLEANGNYVKTFCQSSICRIRSDQTFIHEYGSTELMRITTGGNVGIGTGANLGVNQRLVVYGTGNFTKDLIVNGTQFVVNSTNKFVGIGTRTPSSKLTIYDGSESTTITDLTQAVSRAGILVSSDYTTNAYTPGIFWQTQDNNPTKPKAGIFMKETNSGSQLYFGTSSAYATGINNPGLYINERGYLIMGSSIASNQQLLVIGSTNISKDLIVNSNLIFANSTLNRVGIGKVPLNYQLDVKGNVTMNRTFYINNGKVGIGLSEPKSILHVEGNVTITKNLSIGKNVTLLNLKSCLGRLYTDANGVIRCEEIGWNSSSNRVYLNKNSTTKVGIGTTIPKYKLEVVGNFSVKGVNGSNDFIVGTNTGRASHINMTSGSGGNSIGNGGNGGIIYIKSGKGGGGSTGGNGGDIKIIAGNSGYGSATEGKGGEIYILSGIKTNGMNNIYINSNVTTGGTKLGNIYIGDAYNRDASGGDVFIAGGGSSSGAGTTWIGRAISTSGDPQSGGDTHLGYANFGTRGNTYMYGNVAVDNSSANYRFSVNGTVALNKTLYVINSKVGIGTNSPRSKLAVIGNANITGNLTYKSYLGGMYNYTETGVNIVISVVGTYYNITRLHNINYSNGINFSKNSRGDYLNITKYGLYNIFGYGSFSCGNIGEYGFGVSVNGVTPENSGDCYNHMTGDGHHNPISFNCIRELKPKDIIRLVIDDEHVPATDCSWQKVSLTVNYIGKMV